MKSLCRFKLWLTRNGQTAVVDAYCHSWKCESCVRKRLVPAWQSHLSIRFQREESIYRFTCDVSQWEAVRKAIRRAGGEYARVRIGSRFAVYTTAPIGDQLSPDAACHRLIEDCKSIQLGHRGFSSSRRWKLKEKKSSGFTRLEQQPQVSTRALERAADELGIVLQRWKKSADFTAIGSGFTIPKTADLTEFIATAKRLTAYRVPPGCPEFHSETLGKKQASEYSDNVAVRMANAP